MIKKLNDEILNGDLDLVKSLINDGADVNNHTNPLARAVAEGKFEMVNLLLDNGANVHLNNDKALCISAQYGYFEISDLLIRNGADVNAQEGKALIDAAGNRETKIVNLLLENGAVLDSEVSRRRFLPQIQNLFAKNDEKLNAVAERDLLLSSQYKSTSSEIAGDNELHTALRSGDIAEAIRLISEVDGKLIQQVNDEGKRPFKVADVKAIGSEKDTALHLAAMWGDTEDVLSLIERGADLKAVNDEGCTPLQAAKLYDNNSDVSDVIRANMPRERSRM